MKIKNSDYQEFNTIASLVISNLDYQKMKEFMQHKNTSVYDHCLNVAIRAFMYGKKHKLDYISMTRGALFHDFFLYDWHDKNKGFRLHGYKHPKISLKNSLKHFTINRIEKDIIVNHMFPLTLFSFPKSKESFIVCMIDKCVAIKEIFKKDMKVEIVYD